jgi:small-conductance mechanosensitive channel
MFQDYIANFKLTGFEGLNFAIALVVCALVAKTADFFFNKVLRRLARKTRITFDDQILDIIHVPVLYGVFLLGAAQSLSLLSLEDPFLFWIRAAIHTVLLLILTVGAIRLSTLLIDGIFRRFTDLTGIGSELKPLLTNLAKVGIIVAFGMGVLSVWRLDITPLLASAGIAGVAVALAAKDTLANFFGGVSIFVDRPYRIGDYIVMDDGQRGEVVQIGVRSTRIKTRDDILITVPNSVMANTKIINQSAPIPNFRIRIAVGVAYGVDVDHVEGVLNKLARENEMVLKDPAPRVRFRSFGDSALNFELLCWCENPALKGRLVHELNRSIYKTFQTENIQIPFPQRDVHLYGTDVKGG